MRPAIVASVRVDPQTTLFVERIVHQTGCSKSDVVRDALNALQRADVGSSMRPPAAAMAHLIGTWDSGGKQLSERTGERFVELLQVRKQKHGARRRRSAHRAN